MKVTIRANMIPPGIYLVAVAEPTSGFQMNDVAVPLWSQSPGTPFVQSSTLFRRNHASIAFPDAAEHCLWFIRYTAQPLDPGLKGLQ